jgi:hypothetical protein
MNEIIMSIFIGIIIVLSIVSVIIAIRMASKL